MRKETDPGCIEKMLVPNDFLCQVKSFILSKNIKDAVSIMILKLILRQLMLIRNAWFRFKFPAQLVWYGASQHLNDLRDKKFR